MQATQCICCPFPLLSMHHSTALLSMRSLRAIPMGGYVGFPDEEDPANPYAAGVGTHVQVRVHGWLDIMIRGTLQSGHHISHPISAHTPACLRRPPPMPNDLKQGVPMLSVNSKIKLQSRLSWYLGNAIVVLPGCPLFLCPTQTTPTCCATAPSLRGRLLSVQASLPTSPLPT